MSPIARFCPQNGSFYVTGGQSGNSVRNGGIVRSRRSDYLLYDTGVWYARATPLGAAHRRLERAYFSRMFVAGSSHQVYRDKVGTTSTAYARVAPPRCRRVNIFHRLLCLSAVNATRVPDHDARRKKIPSAFRKPGFPCAGSRNVTIACRHAKKFVADRVRAASPHAPPCRGIGVRIS
jgi:hypothetical protein